MCLDYYRNECMMSKDLLDDDVWRVNKVKRLTKLCPLSYLV